MPINTPYAYRWDKPTKTIEVIPEEAKVYRKIVSLYIDQRLGMLDIAERLSKEGIPTPSAKRKSGRAKHWSSYTVRNILINPAYMGEAVHNRHVYEATTGDKHYWANTKDEKPETEWVTVTYPPLINEQRWDQIQLRREQQKIQPKKHHKGYEEHFMAENVLVCGECGGKVVKHLKREKIGARFYFTCYWKKANRKILAQSNRTRCILKYVDAEKIDHFIFSQISHVLSNPSRFATQWLKNPDASELQSRIKTLQTEEADREKRINRAYDLITETDDAKAVTHFKQRLKSDSGELKDIQRELKRRVEAFALIRHKTNKLAEFERCMKSLNRRKGMKLHFKTEAQFAAFLTNLPFAEKKRILEAVISPETGGKAILRYPTPFDILDGEELRKIPKEKRHQPLTDHEPFVELVFDLDLDRLENLITSLNHGGFLDKVSLDPAAIDLNKFEGVLKLALRIVSTRNEHPMIGHCTLAHAAGIGCVSGHQTAVGQFNIGQKTLIAAHQPPLDQGSRQLHFDSSAISHSAMPRR